MIVDWSISRKIAYLVHQEIAGLGGNGDRDGCRSDVEEESAVIEDMRIRSSIQKDEEFSRYPRHSSFEFGCSGMALGGQARGTYIASEGGEAFLRFSGPVQEGCGTQAPIILGLVLGVAEPEDVVVGLFLVIALLLILVIFFGNSSGVAAALFLLLFPFIGTIKTLMSELVAFPAFNFGVDFAVGTGNAGFPILFLDDLGEGGGIGGVIPIVGLGLRGALL